MDSFIYLYVYFYVILRYFQGHLFKIFYNWNLKSTALELHLPFNARIMRSKSGSTSHIRTFDTYTYPTYKW